jgi:hypothetical protein
MALNLEYVAKSKDVARYLAENLARAKQAKG